MAKNARIGVAPGEERISIEVVSGRLADGSIISAPGATGTFRQSAGNGRDLTLRLQAVEVESLLLDARGGVGAPGYDGLDGASGRPPAASGAARCVATANPEATAVRAGGRSDSSGSAGRFSSGALANPSARRRRRRWRQGRQTVRRITPPVAGSTRWMPVVRGAAETARTAPTAATAAWTSCASEERPAARLPAHRRFRGSGVPLPGLSATGRGAG